MLIIDVIMRISLASVSKFHEAHRGRPGKAVAAAFFISFLYFLFEFLTSAARSKSVTAVSFVVTVFLQ